MHQVEVGYVVLQVSEESGTVERLEKIYNSVEDVEKAVEEFKSDPDNSKYNYVIQASYMEKSGADSNVELESETADESHGFEPPAFQPPPWQVIDNKEQN